MNGWCNFSTYISTYKGKKKVASSQWNFGNLDTLDKETFDDHQRIQKKKKNSPDSVVEG